MPQDNINPVDIEVENTSNYRAKYALAILVLVLVAFIIAAKLFMSGGASNETSLKPQTPRQAYLNILGETHTGLRLVRLRDYVANTPARADIPRANTAIEVLALHEQKSWAKLTDALYDLTNTQTQKQQALAAYKSSWGVWSRQQDLPKLLQATLSASDILETTQYIPNAKRSKFRKPSPDTELAGAVPVGITTLPAISSPPPKSVVLAITAPRIKFSKRPRYPRQARRKGVEAEIILALDIDERGNVARTTVVSINAARYKDKFIRAARRAAMASKFHPKTVAGKPTASSGYIRKYSFTAGG